MFLYLVVTTSRDTLHEKSAGQEPVRLVCSLLNAGIIFIVIQVEDNTRIVYYADACESIAWVYHFLVEGI